MVRDTAPDRRKGGVRLQDLEELYQLYSPDIYRYLCGLTHDPVWAEDLLSETFLKAVRAFGRFEGRSSVKTWLFAIARNVWVDALRRKRPTLSYDDMLAGYLEQDMPDPRAWRKNATPGIWPAGPGCCWRTASPTPAPFF